MTTYTTITALIGIGSAITASLMFAGISWTRGRQLRREIAKNAHLTEVLGRARTALMEADERAAKWFEMVRELQGDRCGKRAAMRLGEDEWPSEIE